MTEKNDTSIAAALRRGREARGESLEQIQRRIGVSLKVLQGIEAGDFDVVEPVYARLAIWHYAEHVGLGGDAMVARFAREVGIPDASVPVRTAPSSSVPVTPVSPVGEFLRRQPLGRLVGAAIALLLALLLALALLSGDEDTPQVFDQPDDYLSSPLAAAGESAPGRPAGGPDSPAADGGAPPPVPSPRAGQAQSATAAGRPAASTDGLDRHRPASNPASRDESPGATPDAGGGREERRAPVPPEPQAASPAAAVVAAGEATPTTTGAQDTAAAPGAATAAANDEDRAQTDEAGVAQTVALDSAPVPAQDPGAAPDAAIILEAHAVDSTWVQVQWDGVDGIEETIPQGETRRWEAQRFFMVRAGRAHGVHFYLQGELLGDGRLGEATRVLRFRGLADGYQLLSPELEPLGAFTRLSSSAPDRESVDAERP